MANETKATNYMDIDALIEKVSKLPIPDTEKADLLRKFKENMMNPDRGEIENLNRIQSKYSTMYPTSSTSIDFLPSINPSYSPSAMPGVSPSHVAMPGVSPSPMAMMMPPMQQPQQGLTVAHFEVLKNKMDSIQLELVDLLRHVKDYTQRYMNATRQQDMEKIDAYINGLFEVDKQLKRAEEQAAAMTAVDEAEAAAAGPEKSTITRATDGIKNFLGGIGEGVSGITSFVSSTANIVNDTLSKKVLGGSTTPTTSATTSNTLLPTATPNGADTPTTAKNTASPIRTANNNTSTSTRTSTLAVTNTKGNIVSVDDYIQSNMNQLNTTGVSSTTPSIGANANNTTTGNNINAMAKPKPKTKEETAEGNQEEITAAINKLNDTMNADIANTVSQGAQSGGARQENHLTKKIRMLRLRLTKQKLEEQLLGKQDKTKSRNLINNRKLNSRKTKKYIKN